MRSSSQHQPSYAHGDRSPRSIVAFALLALALLAGASTFACDDGGGTRPDEFGFVTVLIDGLASGVTTAGQATITGPGIDTTVALPPIASATVPVPVGTYNVVYLPPAGHTIQPGTPNQQTVAVAEDDTAEVSFFVVQASGTMHFAISGIQAGSANGGSAQVLRTDVGGQTPVTVNLPASGSLHASFLPGVYHVTYTPPAGHTIAGGSNEQDVNVAADDTAEVAFTVAIASGGLRIVVTGLAGGAASGGSAQVVRTDIGGQTPITVNIPASGTAVGSLLPGTYSIDYSPPAGHALAAGQVDPRSVNVVANDTATTTYVVEPTAPPQAVAFKSDWSTALGTTQAALLDQGQPLPWNQIIGNGTLNEVIPSTGLDFPTANVLRVQAEFRAGVGGAAQTIRRNGGLPVPAVGQSLYYRWYIRVIVPDSWSNDPLTHPIQDAGSNTNWEWEVRTNTDGTWIAEWNLAGGGGNSFPNNRWGPHTPLQKGVTYRFEHQVRRISASQFTLHARIYQGNTLLFDDDDIRNVNSSTALSDSIPLNFADVNELSGIQAGFNGLTGGTASDYPMILYYQGGFCIRTDTWCGPYEGGI